MKQEEWIRRYRDLNAQEPSAEEIEAAVKTGAISTSSSEQSLQTIKSDDEKSVTLRSNFKSLSQNRFFPPKSYTALLKFLAVVVYAIVATAAFVITGLYWKSYNDANIEGTWEQTTLIYYDAQSDSWKDAFKAARNNDYTYLGLLTVDEERHFNETGLYYALQGTFEDYPVVTVKSYLTDFYRVNQWNKTIEIDVSSKAFEKNTKKILNTKLKSYYKRAPDVNLKKDVSRAKLLYTYDINYRVDGDHLTIYTRNAAGKLVRKATYKRITGKRLNKVKKIRQHIKSKFEHNYMINLKAK